MTGESCGDVTALTTNDEPPLEEGPTIDSVFTALSEEETPTDLATVEQLPSSTPAEYNTSDISETVNEDPDAAEGSIQIAPEQPVPYIGQLSITDHPAGPGECTTMATHTTAIIADSEQQVTNGAGPGGESAEREIISRDGDHEEVTAGNGSDEEGSQQLQPGEPQEAQEDTTSTKESWETGLDAYRETEKATDDDSQQDITAEATTVALPVRDFEPAIGPRFEAVVGLPPRPTEDTDRTRAFNELDSDVTLVEMPEGTPTTSVSFNEAALVAIPKGRSGELHTSQEVIGGTIVAGYVAGESECLLGLSHITTGNETMRGQGNDYRVLSAEFAKLFNNLSRLEHGPAIAHLVIATQGRDQLPPSPHTARIQAQIEEAIEELGSLPWMRIDYRQYSRAPKEYTVSVEAGGPPTIRIVTLE